MDGWLKKKPSPSMVVALIALFVAMTGVATAGKGTKLGKNSVKSSNIAPGAVGQSDLGAAAVTERSLSPHAVGGGAIQPDAVDETKLAPNSVTGEALASESVGPEALAPSDEWPHASVRLDAPPALSVPEFTPTVVPLEEVQYAKPSSMLDPAHPTRVYATRAGRYRITVKAVWFAGAEVSSRGIAVWRNGSLLATNQVGDDNLYNVSTGLKVEQELNTTFVFQAGDYIELFASQSGAPPADNPVDLAGAKVIMEWTGK